MVGRLISFCGNLGLFSEAICWFQGLYNRLDLPAHPVTTRTITCCRLGDSGINLRKPVGCVTLGLSSWAVTSWPTQLWNPTQLYGDCFISHEIRSPVITLPETSSKSPSKLMLGMRSFPSGSNGLFSGANLLLVSGRVINPSVFPGMSFQGFSLLQLGKTWRISMTQKIASRWTPSRSF